MTLRLAILICAISFASHGQKAKGEKRWRPGIGAFIDGMTPRDPGQGGKMDRLVIDIYHCNWAGDKNGVKTTWRSVGLNIGYFHDFPFGRRSRVAFALGPRYSFYNHHHTGFLDHGGVGAASTDYTLISPLQFATQRKLNKFSAHHLELPIEFRFRFGERRWDKRNGDSKGEANRFKIYVGGVFGWAFNSYAKWKDPDGKFLDYNFPDNNPLRYGATMRLGLGALAIYGAYYFSPVFTDSGSSKLYPWTVGVSILML